jgi:signal transduction histidine kinase
VTVDEGELRAGFAAFTAAAARLEDSYARLQTRAAAIDHELQATNRALQQALVEREAIFRALPLGIVALRADGEVTFQNDEAARLCAAARAQGRDLALAAPGEVNLPDCAVRVRWVELPEGRLALLEDRSRIQELEREVHRLDRLAGLSELALGVAHEIKNPLNGALGFCALLERQTEPEACRRFAGKVADGLRRVDRIVKAMLGFAAPGRARGRTATLAAVVAEAAAAVNLPRGRIACHGRIDVAVDGDALARVLANLFGNAIDAGGPRVALQLHASVAAGRLELIVADDGPGVPAALGQRIFEPFVSGKPRGTGLGLPLCARVLGYLGGDLCLLNPGEPGARFRVRVPLAEAAAAAGAGG